MLSSSASISRVAILVCVTGVLVLLAAAAAVAWALLFGETPALDRLEHVSGAAQSATLIETGTAGRTRRVVGDRGGTAYELTLASADQLPARDWPLESVRPGDRVIAWYAPD